MKCSFPKSLRGIGIICLLLFFIFCTTPFSSGEALESGGRVATHGFGPGTMVLLGGILVGFAGWARNKYNK